MKIGRNFTNLLYANYLDDEEKRKFLPEKISIADLDVEVEIRAKADIGGQVEAARALGIYHVEFDGTVPNPYLKFDGDQRRRAREVSISNGVSLSLLLPSAFITSGLCSPDEYSRRLAVKLQKRYVEFASDVGCKYCVTYPGWVPFYHVSGKSLERVRSNLIKSLVELGKFSSGRGIALHLKNNIASSSAFVGVDEMVNVVREVRKKGSDLSFCFDIGHWFARADVGKDVPPQPESILEQIPAELIKELHLSDYVPGKGVLCPPLHERSGLLKRENLERYADLVKKKGAELVVVSTALRPDEQVGLSDEVLREETKYLRSFFG